MKFKFIISAILLAVSLASVSLAQTTYNVGSGGCGNNHINCNALPVSDDTTFSFGTIGISNGQPELGNYLWYFNGQQGTFSQVTFTGYPFPTPNGYFYFTLEFSGSGLSTKMSMRAYKGRYGVINYQALGGTVTVE